MSRKKRAKFRASMYAPEGIGGILGRAGEDRFSKKRLPIPLHVWGAAVGLKIAARARPTALDRGVLTIRVATSGWANELSLLAPEIRARLKERGIEVRELVFRVGAIESIGAPMDFVAKKIVAPPAPLPPSIVESLATVEDPELRAAIEAAARAGLGMNRILSATEARRDARAPRDAGEGTDPRDRAPTSGRGDPRRTP